jgi:hypothetical protein
MARKWVAEGRIRRFESGGIEAMVRSWQYFTGPVYRLCKLTEIVVGLSNACLRPANVHQEQFSRCFLHKQDAVMASSYNTVR